MNYSKQMSFVVSFVSLLCSFLFLIATAHAETDVRAILLSQTTSIGGSGVDVGVVKLTEPAGSGGQLVTLDSTNPKIAHVPKTVKVPPGRSIAPFLIETSSVESATQVTISASITTSASAVFIVQPNSVESITIGPNPIPAGEIAAGLVNLKAVTATSVTVNLSANIPSIVLKPSSVVIPQGKQHGSFTIETSSSNLNQTAKIIATFNGQSKASEIAIKPASQP